MYAAYDRLLRGLSPGGARSALILLVNWAHQGFFSLGKTDRAGKILLEGLLTTAFFLGITAGTTLALLPAALVSLALGHTGNWILNTNVHATRRAGGRFLTQTERLRTALRSLEHRLKRARIAGALLGGSGLREEWGSASDLDVHVVRRPGVGGALGGVLAVVKERSRAFFTRIPLDIYLEDPGSGRLTRAAEAAQILVGDRAFLRILREAGIPDPGRAPGEVRP